MLKSNSKAKSPTKGLPFEVELPEHSEHLNMIVYGDTGVGKTHLCGTAVQFAGSNPVLFIDVEGGTKTLHGVKVDVTRPRSWKEWQTIYEYFLHDNRKYKAVIIDPLTELQKRSMATILGELDTGGGNYADLEKAIAPSRQDWLRSGEQMRKIIRGFRDLAYLPDIDRRVHVIMTALEKYDEKKQLICPSLPGALGVECGAMVDILVRLSRQHQVVTDEDTGEEKSIIRRHLLTDDYVDDMGIKYMAKNRGNRLGRAMWDPTIEKILGVWGQKEPKPKDALDDEEDWEDDDNVS